MKPKRPCSSLLYFFFTTQNKFFFVSASGKIVLDKLAQETKASVLSNLTNVVHGLGLIKNDLIKINDSITDLRDRSSQLELGAYFEQSAGL